MQLLNVLEWAHIALPGGPGGLPGGAGAGGPWTEPPAAGTRERGVPAGEFAGLTGVEAGVEAGPELGAEAGNGSGGVPAPDGHGASAPAADRPAAPASDAPVPDAGPDGPSAGGRPARRRARRRVPEEDALTVVVLSPHDPMTRGQLRRVAELARDEGITVQWQDARGGATAPLKTVGSLARTLRRARRVVIGDPFSRYVQLLLTLTTARDLVVVDDGTATMEFVAQLAEGERLVRWHRKGAAPAGLAAQAQAALFAPFARRARTRLTPGGARPGPDTAHGSAAHGSAAPGSTPHGSAAPGSGPGAPVGSGAPGAARRVEIFSSMPVEATAARLRELGVTVTANDFAWTRARFGPPRLTRGTDLVGTSLVETGVVDLERYLDGVAQLARAHGATRYFAHRRESSEKLHRVQAATGLEIVRPDLPLELVARRGPIGRTVVSFPSTVVHTLPLALAGTPVSVAVCEVDRTWFTAAASPRAEGFLSGVTDSARRVRKLGGTATSISRTAAANGNGTVTGTGTVPSAASQ